MLSLLGMRIGASIALLLLLLPLLLLVHHILFDLLQLHEMQSQLLLLSRLSIRR